MNKESVDVFSDGERTFFMYCDAGWMVEGSRVIAYVVRQTKAEALADSDDDTPEYALAKKRGIEIPVPGKGIFFATPEKPTELKVFLANSRNGLEKPFDMDVRMITAMQAYWDKMQAQRTRAGLPADQDTTIREIILDDPNKGEDKRRWDR
jgi:hypothetical protein